MERNSKIFFNKLLATSVSALILVIYVCSAIFYSSIIVLNGLNTVPFYLILTSVTLAVVYTTFSVHDAIIKKLGEIDG